MRAVLIVFVGTAAAGTVAIRLAQSYRPALAQWLTQDPAAFPTRVRLTFAGLTALLCLPGLAAAAYFWWLGTRAHRLVAFALAAAFTGLAVTLWRFASLLVASR